MVTPANPIIYQNRNCTVTLLDIPTSIACAQGTPDHSSKYTLLSSEPQEVPYITNEPKSEKARQKLQQNTVDAQLHEEYRALIEAALAEIKAQHCGKWCLPRIVSPMAVKRGSKKRKADSSLQADTKAEEQCEIAPFDLSPELFIAACTPEANETTQDSSSDATAQPDVSSSKSSNGPIKQWNGFFENTQPIPINLKLARFDDSTHTATFRIPPHSSFLLGKCDATSNLDSFHRPRPNTNHTPPSSPPPKFNLILLDPPWPNRSVRRASTYSTSYSLPSTRTLLTNLNLPTHLKPNGYIAIWTTNKPSFRHLILSPTDGLFSTWDMQLVEEWIWVKVTTNGTPITPLDSLWRKPYEVLLIGRASTADLLNEQSRRMEGGGVRRRVIAAVPDLHSRKFCLDELFKEILGLSRDNGMRAEQSVLEVFARNLVAGWCSWGDEVLRFNQDICWSLDEAHR